jgi:hypothetical protein
MLYIVKFSRHPTHGGTSGKSDVVTEGLDGSLGNWNNETVTAIVLRASIEFVGGHSRWHGFVPLTPNNV